MVCDGKPRSVDKRVALDGVSMEVDVGHELVLIDLFLFLDELENFDQIREKIGVYVFLELPVHVKSGQVAPVVPADHPIGVQHRDDLEDKGLP